MEKKKYPPAYRRYRKKHKNISVLVTKEEHEEIKKLAEEAELPITAFVRMCIFDTKELIEDIARIFNRVVAEHINEVAKKEYTFNCPQCHTRF